MGRPFSKTVNLDSYKADKSIDIKLDFIINFDTTTFTYKKDKVIVYVLV